MKAALRVIFFMVFYACLMPPSAVTSFFYFATTFSYVINGDGPLMSWNILTEFTIAIVCAAVFVIALQRSLIYRRTWIDLFKRRDR